MKYDLMIVYADSSKIIIKGVDKYGYNEESGILFLEKNGVKSFVPSNHVLFFGLEKHLKGNECYE